LQLVSDGTTLKFDLLKPCGQLIGHTRNALGIQVRKIVSLQRVNAQIK